MAIPSNRCLHALQPWQAALPRMPSTALHSTPHPALYGHATHHNLLDLLRLHSHSKELRLHRNAPPAGSHLRQARQRKWSTGVVRADLHPHDAVAVCGEVRKARMEWQGGQGHPRTARVGTCKRYRAAQHWHSRANGQRAGLLSRLMSQGTSCPASCVQSGRTSVHLAIGGGAAGRAGKCRVRLVTHGPCAWLPFAVWCTAIPKS